MSHLAERLYRAFVFGEELDDEWGKEVLATARARRVPSEQVILEAVREAEGQVRRRTAVLASGRQPKLV